MSILWVYRVFWLCIHLLWGWWWILILLRILHNQKLFNKIIQLVLHFLPLDFLHLCWLGRLCRLSPYYRVFPLMLALRKREGLALTQFVPFHLIIINVLRVFLRILWYFQSWLLFSMLVRLLKQFDQNYLICRLKWWRCFLFSYRLLW